jgi:serine/threonine-protein kinase HipA
MKRTIQVFLNNDHVGTLRYNLQGRRESASFEYAKAWLDDAKRFPLEPGLPLVTGAQFYKKSKESSIFFACIADTEPDGWGRRVILRDHTKRRALVSDLPPLNELDFLLAVNDVNRVGALRFQDEDMIFQRAPEPNRRTTPPLIELSTLLNATHALETDSETAADLAYLRGGATSLGGLRPKCNVIDDNKILSIAKFPSVSDKRAVTKGEVLAMQLAKAAGIHVAKTRLVRSEGAYIALIQRFDRQKNGERILYVSAATMLGARSDDAQEHTYTEIVDSIRAYGANAQENIEELWRRITFSILITNVDDHLHNHGFLHVEGGKWDLSPAFDLNPFPDRIRELKTWLSAEIGPQASIAGVLEFATYCRISGPKAKTMLAKIENAVAAWRAVGKTLGMTQSELNDFAPAFEHTERDVARKKIG